MAPNSLPATPVGPSMGPSSRPLPGLRGISNPRGLSPWRYSCKEGQSPFRLGVQAGGVPPYGDRRRKRESRCMPQDLNPETLSIHMDSLRRAARGMTRSHHDAEDLVQDMLVKVLARPRQIGPAGEAAYLHQALRNTHISRLRTKERRPVLAPLEPEDTRLVAPAARRAGRGAPHARDHRPDPPAPHRPARGDRRRRRRRPGLHRGRRRAPDPGRDRDEPPAPRPRAPAERLRHGRRPLRAGTRRRRLARGLAPRPLVATPRPRRTRAGTRSASCA